LQEGECFAAAAALDTHKALVHIFFAQRATKKVRGSGGGEMGGRGWGAYAVQTCRASAPDANAFPAPYQARPGRAPKRARLPSAQPPAPLPPPPPLPWGWQVRGVTDAGLRPRAVRRVAVLGGGLMGSGIATALALAGVEVTLKEVNQQFLDVSHGVFGGGWGLGWGGRWT
jgi:hypothetical protein